METGLQTLVTAVAAKPSAASQTALLVCIYPTGPCLGSRFTLGQRPVAIGRSEDCDIHVEHNSVSRRHACVEPGPDGYQVRDLQSTNGTFVNNVACQSGPLRDGDYLRVGSCIFRFLAGGNVETEYHEEVYRMAILDALTDLPNKRYLLEFLERELARVERRGLPLSVVMFDIDHFKRINDDMGHQAGDFTLSGLAARIRTVVRREELLARYGGEEFTVVLPDTSREEALQVAERIRELVAGAPFTYDGEEYQVTISLGVATAAGERPLTVAEFLREADNKLYKAKHAGRNRVEG
jgi:diguanylate cyclase (GGDEF)-like protein